MELHYEVSFNEKAFVITDKVTGDVACYCDTIGQAMQVVRALEIALRWNELKNIP